MKWQDYSKTCLTTVKISLVLTVVLSFAVVAPAVEDTWTQKADMPTARGHLSTAALNGKVFAIGGALSASTSTAAVEEYDPATDKWTIKASLPEAICGISTSAIDGKIYAIGALTSPYGTASSRVYVYDPAANTWARKADMPTARGYLSTSVVNGKIYAIGGCTTGVSQSLKTVEVYDPATDTWTRKADMPTARLAHSAGVVDGKIYVVGGTVGAPWAPFSTLEAYDPATNTWTKKADMPSARWGLGTSEVCGKIYAIGGAGASSAVEEYDPVTDTWTRKADMPTARRTLSASAVEGKIYAVGGFIPGSVAVPTVEEYDTGLGVPSPDFNGDGKVDIQDLLRLIESWGQNDPSVDIAPPPFGDGIIDVKDLEVLMSYWQQEVLPVSLLAYWKLDETEGNIAADSAGNNDALLMGKPAWQADGGMIDGALELDGDDFTMTDFVLNPADGEFSVFAWVKGGAPGQVVVSQAGGANWLLADPSAGKLMTSLTRPPGGRGTPPPLVSEFVITDGNWHRVGLTWDGSNRLLYVDDVEVARDTQASLGAATTGLYIGAGKNLEPGSFWSGLIDDVRIYDRAVTP